jgi:uncharacterized protein (DUF934 family)
MALIVHNGQIAIDSWQLRDTAETLASATSADLDKTAGTLVPLLLWLQRRETLKSTRSRLGILLQGNDDPACIVADLAHIELIAVNIARFTDGRGYSVARLLRGRYGYRGELRAVGDILQDQLYYLLRVGFDAFELRADQNLQAAAAALSAFSASYQSSSDEPLPLFRRRLAFA